MEGKKKNAARGSAVGVTVVSAPANANVVGAHLGGMRNVGVRVVRAHREETMVNNDKMMNCIMSHGLKEKHAAE